MSAQRISNRDFAASASLMLAAALSLSFVALFAKQLSSLTDLSIVVFLRFFVPFLMLLWLGLVPFSQAIRLSQPWRVHFIRAFFTVSSQYCFLFYLMHGSLLIGTLLFTTSGLFLPFISYICFGSNIKRKTLLAIVISFVGIAFILSPSSGFNSYLVIGLLAGFLNACSQATVHYAAKRGSTFDVTLMMFAVSSLYTGIIVLLLGKFHFFVAQLTAAGYQNFYLMMIILAVFTISNQSLRTKAYRYVNKPASLTPFYYMAIVFSALLDGLVYHQAPQWHAYLGILLMLIAAVIMSWRGRRPQSSANVK